MLGLALLIPGPVAAVSGPATWGWVTARHPTTASYVPAAHDQGNSAGKTNKVIRESTGVYDVLFPKLGINGNGTALVTALGSTPRFCTIGDIGDDVTGLASVFVQCHGVSGVPLDSQFSIVYSRGGTDSRLQAYLWANQPSSTVDYTPDTNYQFNAVVVNNSNLTNTVHRDGVGTYEVHLPSMPASEGNLQVSADGVSSCRLVSWSNSAGTLVATVKCWSVPPATLTDQYYDLMFTDAVGMAGVAGPSAAYLFANKPTASAYTPAAAYLYSTGSTPSIKRTGIGAYVVNLPGMPKGGAAVVTAVGSGKSRCQLGSISTTTPQKVGVRCFTPSGNPTDSQFTFSYTN